MVLVMTTDTGTAPVPSSLGTRIPSNDASRIFNQSGTIWATAICRWYHTCTIETDSSAPDGLCTDESPLEVCVDDASCLRRCHAGLDSPRPRLCRP